MIEIVLHGSPRGKGRGRVARGGHHVYTPSATRQYEAWLRSEGQRAWGNRPLLLGAVSVHVIAVVEIPRSWPAKKRKAALMQEIFPISRPDVDNYQKAALDSLNGVCWRDDAQVVRLLGEKMYGDRPCLIVRVDDHQLITGAILNDRRAVPDPVANEVSALRA